MKLIRMKILTLLFEIKSIFIKKKNSNTKSYTFETNDEDWEQYNDNVSF